MTSYDQETATALTNINRHPHLLLEMGCLFFKQVSLFPRCHRRLPFSLPMMWCTIATLTALATHCGFFMNNIHVISKVVKMSHYNYCVVSLTTIWPEDLFFSNHSYSRDIGLFDTKFLYTIGHTGSGQGFHEMIWIPYQSSITRLLCGENLYVFT